MTNNMESIETLGTSEPLKPLKHLTQEELKTITVAEAEERNEIMDRINKRKREIAKSLLTKENLTHFKATIFEHNYTDNEFYKKEYEGKDSPVKTPAEQRESDQKVLRGAIFEELTRHERESSLDESFPVANELQYLIAHPDLFKLADKIGTIRNPDIAYVEIDQRGHIIVKGVGEAKLGFLDQRSLEQLRTFKSNMEKLAEVINNMNAKELNSHGLIELSKLKQLLEENRNLKSKDRKNLVEIAQDFEITLLIPENRANILYDKYEVTEEDIEKALKDKKVVNSIFSVDDVAEIAKVLHKKMNPEKEPEEKENESKN